MFTRCTTCNTWFRIGQDDIRAAHGEVRCGACGARFNALATLCERVPASATEAAPHTEPVTVEPTPAQEPVAPAPEPKIVDEPIEVARPEPEPVEPRIAAEPVAPKKSPKPDEKAPEPAIRASTRRPVPTYVPDAEPETTDKPRFLRVPTWVWWTAGSVVLLLILLSQLVIYEHAALRANPATRGAVEALYSAFGHPLPPRRDLKTLAVTNANVSTAPGAPSKLSVTAQLTNHANFAQAWPLLRVMLTNRFGGAVGGGVYSADHYLPYAPVKGSALQPGETRKVQLQIDDPGSAAVGFVIVPCEPGKNGPVCATK